LRVSKVFGQLGRLALGLGDLAEAERWLRESVARQREVGERAGLATALNQLGWTLLAQARPAEAWRGFAEAERLGAQAGVIYPQLEALQGLLEIRAQALPATESPGGVDLPLLLKLLAQPACQGEVRTRAEALRESWERRVTLGQMAAARARAAESDLSALARAMRVAGPPATDKGEQVRA
jgi:hypothetical protein